MKLMVVDDEPIILNGIIRMIQKANTSFTEIVGAVDGIDALQKLACFQPDLILTDIHMPEMDGLALIKEIQSQNLCNRFIIITGYGDFAYARQALRYHVMDYLLKPINKDELLSVLGRVEQTIRVEQQQTKEHDLLLLKEHILYNTPFEDMPLKPELQITLFPEPYTMVLVIQAYDGTPLLTNERLEDICSVLRQLSMQAYSLQSRFLRQAVLLINGKQRLTDNELQQACGDLFYTMGTKSAGYHIGVSGNQNEKESLRELYIEAMAAMLCNRYFSVSNMTVFRQESEDLVNDEGFAQSGNRTLENQISIEQIEKEMQSIHQLFSGDDDCHNKLRERFLVCVGAHCSAALEDTQVSAISGKLIPFERRQEHKQPHIQAIDKIVTFVEQNYKLDLSLDAVADHVQMHPNYISMLFRKEMGLTFLHYLHTFRLAKAKQFMQDHPEWPINTIAELVGYENPRHFFKVFKKFENTTPGQYRHGNSSL
ncbi:response regulator [Paenibacillus aceris]|uniref:YesN/AraC family two-component response regulator n=1 Tax=Paenibacillus aceris TaxID=869555 RepID=A0ABS4I1Y8_9BACL|nr:response regulator [Paenibacillus aceris]MBP1964571.1 YesN/AraC family two-component response regulator [Paenibacillus aceris]NHW35720.1 response regulator [Paenibacillus aceris]